MTVAKGEALLDVVNVRKYFPLTRGVLFRKHIGDVKAVDDVSFTLHRGETLGLVGESGCGKSTLSRALLRLVEPTGGQAIFEGTDIFALQPADLREMRRRIQIIFQDPYASLNPRMTVGDIVGEAYEIHRGVVPRKEQRRKVRSLLDRVGLNPDYENRYPHQFSGGQRQRIGVARALALNPDIIICDEPVSALDVSVQAQVINLLEELQEEFDLSYIFIAHDLSVVRHIADRVAVMYLGRIVEIGNDQQIYEKPLHPYTQALLSAVPLPDPRTREARERIVLEGDVPSPAKPPSGCHFRTRCWKAEQVCVDEVPDLIDRFDHGHPSRCHFAAPREHVLVAVGAEEAGELETIHAPMSYAPSPVGREDTLTDEADAAAAERQRALRTVATALGLYVVFGAIGFFLLPRTFSGSVLTAVRILLVVHVLACVFLAVRASAGWVAAANLGRIVAAAGALVSLVWITSATFQAASTFIVLAVVAYVCHRAHEAISAQPSIPGGAGHEADEERELARRAAAARFEEIRGSADRGDGG